jgi:hypothetical protein
MLEPCAVKVASTVPRRGVGCEAGSLSDYNIKIFEKRTYEIS